MGVFAVLCACAGLTLLVRLLVHRRRLAELTKNVPSLGGELPIVGHLLMLLGLVRRMLKHRKILDEVGSISKGWFKPSKLIFIVQDPTIASKLMNTCITKNSTVRFATAWVGQGLATCNGDRWKITRKLLNPAFSQHILNDYVKVFNQQAQNLVDALSDHVGKGEFDQGPYLLKGSLDTICQTLIPVNLGNDELVDETYIEAMRRMLIVTSKRLRTIWMHVDFIYKLSETRRDEAKAVKTLKMVSAEALKRKRSEWAESGKSTGNRFKPFMDLLVQLGEEGSLTDTEILDEVDTMVLGGHDTSANVMMFALMLLRTYPDVQDRAYLEIREVFGDGEREVTKDDLPLLKYLEAILKETLRMYPLCPFYGRTADVDTNFDNFMVPAGSQVLVNTMALHRHESWGDPAVFRPERWLDPTTLPQVPVFAGFGLGRRACIGKAFAMMTMKTNMVYILRRYQVYGRSDIPVKTKYDAVVRPIGGHHIQIRERIKQR